jgi:hypothetical protein
VLHGLAVSQNKLGDLHYTDQAMEKACGHYEAALAVRQEALDAARGEGMASEGVQVEGGGSSCDRG